MKYIFCIVALIIQPVFSVYMYKSRSKVEAASRLPLIYISGVYFVVQIYVFIKYCNKFPKAMEKWSYLIQLGILIAFIVVELALLCSKKYIENVQADEQSSIQEFKALIQEMQILAAGVTDSINKQWAESLIERMRCEDPVSSYNVYNENLNIHALISQLSQISDNNEFALKCQEISRQLDIRKIKNEKERG